jgi:phosphoribosyl 1,2-cyclic phosphodiesterase
MHLQVLGSGSKGNATLVRAGETHVLLDSGLSIRVLEERLAAARVPVHRIDHIALTHGHLDHARSAGTLAKKSKARLHCCERLMRNASVKRAPILSTLPVGSTIELNDAGGVDPVALRAVLVPHDADPTVAFRVEHRGRVAVLVTDMGHVDSNAARALAGAHLLVLEFNHDAAMLASGPYSPALKRRVGGPQGHLSNDQAAEMLRLLTGPELHTLVLAHLSKVNNSPELARAAAVGALTEIDRSDVEIIVAEQDAIGANLSV